MKKTIGLTLKEKIASMIGITVMWYDYTTTAILSPLLVAIFFPQDSPITKAAFYFMLYATPLFSRPLGTLVFGNLCDSFGRKLTLIISIFLLFLSSLIIAFSPDYFLVGFFAPAFLIMMKLLRGFAFGGEWVGCAIYVTEHAPENKESSYSAMPYFALFLGGSLAIVMTTLVTTCFSPKALASYGWRILFLFGGLLGLIGFFMRSTLRETPSYQQIVQKKKVVHEHFKKMFSFKKELFLAAGISALDFVSFNIYLFASWEYKNPLFSQKDFPTTIYYGLGFIVCLIGSTFLGRLAQKIGGIKSQFAAALVILILAYPLTRTIYEANGSYALLSYLTLMFLMTFYVSPLLANISKLFPTEIRASCFALAQGVTFAIFGGGSLLFIEQFLSKDHLAVIVPIYITSAAALSVLCLGYLLKRQKTV